MRPDVVISIERKIDENGTWRMVVNQFSVENRS
jgi:hypothetical protein